MTLDQNMKAKIYKFFMVLLLSAVSVMCLSCDRENILCVKVPIYDLYAIDNDIYFVRLLNLALEKSSANINDFQIHIVRLGYTSKRYKNELYKNTRMVDVVWSMSSDENDKNLLRIDFELLKNMNGYRYLVVKSKNMDKFKNIKTIEDLRMFRAGQATDWPDTKVLERNGFVVIKSIFADKLYKMLAAERFEFLPRGIHEVENEIRLLDDNNFSIIDDFIISYDAPVYFYVHKNNKILADRLNTGLSIAKSDGSWDELFFSFKNFKDSIDKINDESIKKIYLSN